MLSTAQQKKLADLKYELSSVEKEFKRLNSLRSVLIAGIRNLEGMASNYGSQNLKVKKQDSVLTREFRTATGAVRLDSNGEEAPINYRQDFMDKTKDLHMEISSGEDDLDMIEDSGLLSPQEQYKQDLENFNKS